MPYRYQTLERVIQGYEATGVSLVGSDGQTVSPEPYVDAGVGLYYLVPLIARTFGVSLDAALTLFAAIAVAGACVLGIVGSFLLLRSAWGRAAAVAGIAVVAALCLRFGEGYLAGAVTVLATIPFFLHLHREGRMRALLVALFLTGLLVGVADQVRSLIATPVLVFILLTLALDGATARRRRIACAAVLLVGALLPRLYAAHLVSERDAFVRATPGARPPVVLGNAMWHPLYIGFGYLPNRHGITYSDEAAIARVKSVDPGAPYLSPRYTAILRDAVLRLVREDPWLVARTVAAKALRVLLILALFAHVGLLLAFRKPRGWRAELPFVGAVGLAAVPGVVGLPVLHYIVGALAFAVVYGAIAVEAAAPAWAPALAPEPAS